MNLIKLILALEVAYKDPMLSMAYADLCFY